MMSENTNQTGQDFELDLVKEIITIKIEMKSKIDKILLKIFKNKLNEIEDLDNDDMIITFRKFLSASIDIIDAGNKKTNCKINNFRANFSGWSKCYNIACDFLLEFDLKFLISVLIEFKFEFKYDISNKTALVWIEDLKISYKIEDEIQIVSDLTQIFDKFPDFNLFGFEIDDKNNKTDILDDLVKILSSHYEIVVRDLGREINDTLITNN